MADFSERLKKRVKQIRSESSTGLKEESSPFSSTLSAFGIHEPGAELTTDQKLKAAQARIGTGTSILGDNPPRGLSDPNTGLGPLSERQFTDTPAGRQNASPPADVNAAARDFLIQGLAPGSRANLIASGQHAPVGGGTSETPEQTADRNRTRQIYENIFQSQQDIAQGGLRSDVAGLGEFTQVPFQPMAFQAGGREIEGPPDIRDVGEAGQQVNEMQRLIAAGQQQHFPKGREIVEQPTEFPTGQEFFDPATQTESAVHPQDINEQEFQQWYADLSQQYGLNPNPDDPTQFYDYRNAFANGLGPDETGHFPSRVPSGPNEGLILKLPGHPTMDKTIQSENEAGFEVKEIGGRIFSRPGVPAITGDPISNPVERGITSFVDQAIGNTIGFPSKLLTASGHLERSEEPGFLGDLSRFINDLGSSPREIEQAAGVGPVDAAEAAGGNVGDIAGIFASIFGPAKAAKMLGLTKSLGVGGKTITSGSELTKTGIAAEGLGAAPLLGSRVGGDIGRRFGQFFDDVLFRGPVPAAAPKPGGVVDRTLRATAEAFPGMVPKNATAALKEGLGAVGPLARIGETGGTVAGFSLPSLFKDALKQGETATGETGDDVGPGSIFLQGLASAPHFVGDVLSAVPKIARDINALARADMTVEEQIQTINDIKAAAEPLMLVGLPKVAQRMGLIKGSVEPSAIAKMIKERDTAQARRGEVVLADQFERQSPEHQQLIKDRVAARERGDLSQTGETKNLDLRLDETNQRTREERTGHRDLIDQVSTPKERQNVVIEPRRDLLEAAAEIDQRKRDGNPMTQEELTERFQSLSEQPTLKEVNEAMVVARERRIRQDQSNKHESNEQAAKTAQANLVDQLKTRKAEEEFSRERGQEPLEQPKPVETEPKKQEELAPKTEVEQKPVERTDLEKMQDKQAKDQNVLRDEIKQELQQSDRLDPQNFAEAVERAVNKTGNRFSDKDIDKAIDEVALTKEDASAIKKDFRDQRAEQQPSDSTKSEVSDSGALPRTINAPDSPVEVTKPGEKGRVEEAPVTPEVKTEPAKPLREGSELIDQLKTPEAPKPAETKPVETKPVETKPTEVVKPLAPVETKTEVVKPKTVEQRAKEVADQTFAELEADLIEHKKKKGSPGRLAPLTPKQIKLMAKWGAARAVQSGAHGAKAVKDFGAKIAKALREKFPGISQSEVNKVIREAMRSAEEEFGVSIDVPRRGREAPTNPEGEELQGLNVAETTRIREIIGLEEMPASQRRGHQEAADIAVKDGKHLPAQARRTAEQLLSGERGKGDFSDSDHIGMNMAIASLRDQLHKDLREVDKALKDGRTNDADNARQRVEGTLKEIDILQQGTTFARREIARALAAGNAYINRDTYEIDTILRSAQQTAGGKISQAMADKFTDMGHQIKKLEENNKKLREEAIAKDEAFERAVAEGVTKRLNNSAVRRVKTKGEKHLAKLHAEQADLKKQLAAEGLKVRSTGGGVESAKVLLLVGKLARNLIEQSVTQLSMGELFTNVKKILPDITDKDIDKALANLDPKRQKIAEKRARNDFKEIQKMAKLRVKLEEAGRGVTPPGETLAPSTGETAGISDPDVVDAIRRTAQGIGLDLLKRERISTHEVLADRVREELRVLLPNREFSLPEIKDAISGLGNFTPATTDPVEVQFAQFRHELQKSRHLEIIEHGELPPKTGRGQVEMTERERQFLKEVNEAKKELENKNPELFKEAKANRQKGALDAAKTAARNHINDMMQDLEAGKESIPKRTKLEGDAELADLKRQEADVRELHRETFKKDKTEAEQKAAAEKTLDRSIDILKTDLSNMKLEATKKGEPVTSPAIEAKKARLAELKANREWLREAFAQKLSPVQIAQLAHNARILRDFADLRDRLMRGDTSARRAPKTETVLSEENQALQNAVDGMKKQIQQLRSKKTRDAKDAEEIADLNRRIKIARKGIVEPPKQRTESKWRPGVDAIKTLQKTLRQIREQNWRSGADARAVERTMDKINRAQGHLDSLSKEVRKNKDQPSEHLKELRDMLTDIMREIDVKAETIYLKEQLRTGEFEVKETRERRWKSPDLEKAEIELQRTKRKVDQAILDQKPLTRGGKALELMNTARTIKATADMSATWRQAAILSARKILKGEVVELGQFNVEAFVAFLKEHKAQEIDNSIRSHPDQYLRDRAKLFLAELDGKLNSKEEFFMSRILERIKGVRVVVRASERHMVSLLNMLRVDAFDSFKKKFPNATDAELRAWADFVNKASGRGDLDFGAIDPTDPDRKKRFKGWDLSGAANMLAVGFFAPRFAASRFQVGTALYKHRDQPRVMREVAKTLASFASIGLTAAGLARLSGAEVSLDPRESDFLKIRFGNKVFDLFAGTQQPFRLLLAGILTGTDATGLTGKHLLKSELGDPLEYIQRFAAFKGAPAPLLVHSLIRGKNIIGQERSVPETLARSFFPIIVESVWDAFWEGKNRDGTAQGIMDGIIIGSAEFVGIGSSTFEISERVTRKRIRKLWLGGKKKLARELKAEWNKRNPKNQIRTVKLPEGSK